MNDNELLDRLAQLPREIMPERDLRAGIAERLASIPQPRSARRYWSYAAAAAALVLITATATRWWTVRDTQVAAVAPSQVQLVSFRAEENRYIAEIATLERVLAREKSKLSPETLAILERNMGVIDKAISESRAALAQDSANAGVRQMVISVYRQKAELLRNTRMVAL